MSHHEYNGARTWTPRTDGSWEFLAKREGELDVDPDVHRLPVLLGRTEAPGADGADGLLVETEVRIERSRDAHLPDAAVRLYHRFQRDDALHLRAHGIGRVVRSRAVGRLGVRDPAAEPIWPAAGAAAA